MGSPENEMLAARLRDAYRAAGDTVRPGAVRPVPDLPGRDASGWAAAAGPGRLPGTRRVAGHGVVGGPSRRGPGSRRPPGARGPIAAATAVLVIILAAAVLAPRIWPGRAGHRTATAAGRPQAAAPRFAAPPPSFFAAVVAPAGAGNASATRLEVFRSATARAQWLIPAPRTGLRFVTVAALGGDRTFVAAAEPVRPSAATCQTWLYRFQLSADGRPAGLAPLAVPRLAGLLHSGQLAASADGRTLAYEPVGCATASVPDQVSVLRLASGQTASWKFDPFVTDPGLLSLSADGRLLGLAGLHSGGTELAGHPADWVLPTSARPGWLSRQARRALGPAAGLSLAALDGDGSATIGFQAAGWPKLRLGAYRTSDGHRIRTIALLPAGGFRQLKQSPAGSHALAAASVLGLGLAVDQGGQHLLLFDLNAPLIMVSRATGRVTTTPPPGSQPGSVIYAAAW